MANRVSRDLSFIVRKGNFVEVNYQRICVTYFFAAEKMMTGGKTDLAREFWQKAVDTGMAHTLEFMAAKRRLATGDEKSRKIADLVQAQQVRP